MPPAQSVSVRVSVCLYPHAQAQVCAENRVRRQSLQPQARLEAGYPQ